jgi:hypothetical protein
MPDLNGAAWLLEAFHELSTTRSYTMGGAAPIPVDRIWQWSDRFNAPSWFSDAVVSIDAKFLETMNG